MDTTTYIFYNMKSQAESIARKIKELRERPTANKHKRERLLLDASQEYAVSLQQEKLQVFCEKIRQLQREIIIKQKVILMVLIITIKFCTGGVGIYINVFLTYDIFSTPFLIYVYI